jgi:antitoxin CcdA
LEQALRKAVSQAKAELWQAENAEAIAAYNQQVAEQGTFAERLGQI